MMEPIMGPMWGCGLAGGLWLLLAAVTLAGVAVVATSSERRRGTNSDGASGSVALSILDERFARGEIDQDDFEQRRRKLQP